MKQSPCPPQTPWATPYITVADVDQALNFYQQAFGFITKNKVTDEDGATGHGEVTYQGQLLMFGKQGAYGSTVKTPANSSTPSPIHMYLYCADVDRFCQAAVAVGAKSIRKPEDTFWGDRMCTLQDIDGYEWSFATYLDARATVQ